MFGNTDVHEYLWISCSQKKEEDDAITEKRIWHDYGEQHEQVFITGYKKKNWMRVWKLRRK